ncbi:hypothetical protein IF2G_03103 [Cordyceps javanica]|nr:hypothetical protein IF2G_03103 [Cordyceps javanica]
MGPTGNEALCLYRKRHHRHSKRQLTSLAFLEPSATACPSWQGAQQPHLAPFADESCAQSRHPRLRRPATLRVSSSLARTQYLKPFASPLAPGGSLSFHHPHFSVPLF